MLEIAYLPKALEEIDRIADHTIAKWGEGQARSYLADIRRKIELAAEYPGMGSEVYGLPASYRKIASDAHFVIYRASETDLTVVRIIHEREDVPEGLDDI